jgi:hypothetical protein
LTHTERSGDARTQSLFHAADPPYQQALDELRVAQFRVTHTRTVITGNSPGQHIGR